MSDENKPENEETLENKIDKLTLTKTGYERNRNLTGCVTVVLGYYIYTGIRDGDGTWWFYLVMGIMFLVAGFILYRSWKTTNELQKDLDALTEEKRARDEAAAEAEAAEDAAFIEAAAGASASAEAASADEAPDADKT